MKAPLQAILATVSLAALTPTIDAAEPANPLILTGSGSYQVAYAMQSVGHWINAFGLDLHQRLAGEVGNTVTSPWSIETALAMTYAGADGQTKAEMEKVLHFPPDEKLMHEGFASLGAGMEKHAANVIIANRLFGQDGKAFHQPFLDTLAKSYRAPFESVSFATDPAGSRQKINGWVAQQTKDRIQDLISDGGISADTRLVLCNAAYFKASWSKRQKFEETPDFEFAVNGQDKSKVTGLMANAKLGYQKIPGGVALTVPYENPAFQFVLLVPDAAIGLVEMEKQLTPDVLASIAKAERKLVMLEFPKFKLQPMTVNLTDHLVKMGMPSAFNQEGKSADFSRMAPITPDDHLFLSAVFHKAFITVDKNGTEAAAATAVVATKEDKPRSTPDPLEVRVDRPFAFAIQHVDSGACLFLGRVTDPR